jgi:ribosomal protein S17
MKRFAGTVVKTNNSKTAHVEIKSEWMHPKYLKKKTISRLFACHDLLDTRVGDQVEIVETRQYSATKFFRVDSITKAVAREEGEVKKVKVAKSASAKKASKKA